jgi:hypothetical protein
MIIIDAVRDFVAGLARGLKLFFTERNERLGRALAPEFKSRGTDR